MLGLKIIEGVKSVGYMPQFRVNFVKIAWCTVYTTWKYGNITFLSFRSLVWWLVLSNFYIRNFLPFWRCYFFRESKNLGNTEILRVFKLLIFISQIIGIIFRESWILEKSTKFKLKLWVSICLTWGAPTYVFSLQIFKIRRISSISGFNPKIKNCVSGLMVRIYILFFSSKFEKADNFVNLGGGQTLDLRMVRVWTDFLFKVWKVVHFVNFGGQTLNMKM